MEWVRRMFGGRRRESVAAKDAGDGFTVTASLSDSLQATIVHRTLDGQQGPIPCWVYESRGLLVHQQQELSFVVRRRPQEAVDAYPRDPLDFMLQVKEMARQGALVTTDGRTGFRKQGFLGAPECSGILYAAYQPLGETTPEVPTLSVIPLLGDEYQASEEFGRWRVLTRLAEATRHYPFPPWFDRDRRPVITAEDLTTTILCQVPTVRTSGVSVLNIGSNLHLRVLEDRRSALAHLFEQMPPEVGPAFLTDLEPTADGCLVWCLGQEQPSAVTPHGSSGSRLCGCFVLFLPTEGPPQWGIREDGFFVILPPADWRRLREALSTGTPCRVSLGSSDLVLEHVRQTIVNPLTGQALVAEGGWRGHGTPSPTNEPVQALGVTLLQGDRELRESGVDLQHLAQLVASLLESLKAVLARHSDARDLEVGLQILPDQRLQVVVEARPPLTQEQTAEIQEVLGSVGNLPSVSRPVQLSIRYRLHGGSDLQP